MPRATIAGFSKRLLIATAFAAALFLQQQTRASAAQIDFIDSDTLNAPARIDFAPVCNATLIGRIEQGDYDTAKRKLAEFQALSPVAPVLAQRQAALRTPGAKVADHYYALCLASPGGDLKEALRIAILFEGWMTVVGLDDQGNPDQCVSACAAIFMRAKRRHGIFASNAGEPYPGRYLHVRATLAFHAPRLEYGPATRETIPRKEAEEAYAAALASVRGLVPSPFVGPFASVIDRTESDLPPQLLVKLLTTPYSDFYRIERVREAHEFGIELFGFEQPKAITDRMLLSACAAVTTLRCSQDRASALCYDKFVTDSQLLGFDRYGTPSAGLAADLQQVEAMLATWKPRRITAWPADKATGKTKDPVRVEMLLLESEPAPGRLRVPCAMQVTYNGDAIVNLEIETLNSRRSRWLPLQSGAPPAGSVTDLVKSAIRPPVKQPLVDISTPQLQATAAAIALGSYRADTDSQMPLSRFFLLGTRLADILPELSPWLHAGNDLLGQRVRFAALPLARHAPAPGFQTFAFPPTWRQTRDPATGIRLTPTDVAPDKAVVVVLLPVEVMSDIGDLDTWFASRLERLIHGTGYIKRQGWQRRGPVLLDGIALPNAQGKAGEIHLFNAWRSISGAQIAIQIIPETVDLNDPTLQRASTLIDSLALQKLDVLPNMLLPDAR